MNQKGVTIIELLVVLGVMGIIAAISMPATFAWLADARFRDTASRLETALRQTRDLAITRKLELQLAVDLDSGDYWIQEPGGTKASSLVDFEALPPNMQITSGNADPGPDCTKTAANGDGNTATAESCIEFNSNGSGEGGCAVIATSICISDGSGAKRYRVRLLLPPATGRVITESWTGSAWN